MPPLSHLPVRGGGQRQEAELRQRQEAELRNGRENEPTRMKGGVVALGGVFTDKNI